VGPRAGLDRQKISPPPGFDPRIVHSQSLYRLSNPAHSAGFTVVNTLCLGYALFQLVELRHYKPEGCGFNFHWGCLDFSSI